MQANFHYCPAAYVFFFFVVVVVVFSFFFFFSHAPIAFLVRISNGTPVISCCLAIAPAVAGATNRPGNTNLSVGVDIT